MDIANDILFSLSSRAEAGHAWHHSDEVLFNIIKFDPFFTRPATQERCLPMKLFWRIAISQR